MLPEFAACCFCDANKGKIINHAGEGYLGADFNRWNNGTLMAEEKDNRKVHGSFLILNFMRFSRIA